MLENMVKNWFQGYQLEDLDDFSLYCSSPVVQRTPLLHRKFVSIDLFVDLKKDIINFQAMASVVVNYLEARGVSPRRTTGIWLFVSPRGGIYLHETLASKENLQYSGMKNRFLVLNSADGSFSFSPGSVYNREYTDRMQDLIDQSRTLLPAEFLHRFGELMNRALVLKGYCNDKN